MWGWAIHDVVNKVSTSSPLGLIPDQVFRSSHLGLTPDVKNFLARALRGQELGSGKLNNDAREVPRFVTLCQYVFVHVVHVRIMHARNAQCTT